MGTLGIGIMNSTAFLLLANSSPEVDENKKMELTLGSMSFHARPSGSTCLSDLAKSGPSTSKTEIITKSRSFVGSSSEANSPVSPVMSTHTSVLVDSVGPPSAEVCRTAASFP
jgi:hypothetical protein